jgi:hypothetical protein
MHKESLVSQENTLNNRLLKHLLLDVKYIEKRRKVIVYTGALHIVSKLEYYCLRRCNNSLNSLSGWKNGMSR